MPNEPKLTVDVLQFLMPDGRRNPTSTTLPIECRDAYNDMLAHGCRFEAEMLQTGEVSVSIDDSEDYVDISVTPNGPEVQAGMVEMLKRGLWKTPRVEAND